MSPLVKLREIMFESGFKDFAIARRASIDPTLFSRIKNGHRKPTEQQKRSIADALGVTYADLWQDRENG